MIQFPEDLVLENERVLLRPLQQQDLEFLKPFAEQEPEIWTYSLVSAAGITGMKTYIDYAIEQRHLRKEYPFIVFDKKAKAFAGSTRFYNIQLAFSTTILGYTWYGKKFQRTGLNRHCKLLMLDYAFEQWGMERVEFQADLRNEKSIQAMKDIGCTVEGIMRSTYPIKGAGRRDSIVLSILRDEWFDSAKKNLLEKIH
ncbi:MAG TPA: GNAT family protein [Puia sp.]|jgi:RimJ/RimL family protein N-acetyltransferase|nr:GNAT family protein [Puia sp.]